MNTTKSAWSRKITLAEQIKANEEIYKKIESETLAKKEAILKKEKEAKNIETILARFKAQCELKTRQETEKRASYKKLIPYEWREIWNYCDTRTHGKMYQDFIIAAFESNKLKLIDMSVILLGSEAVIEEAAKHHIKF